MQVWVSSLLDWFLPFSVVQIRTLHLSHLLQDNSSDDEPLIKHVDPTQNQNKRRREDDDDEEAQNKDDVSRKKKSRFAPDPPGDNIMLLMSAELCLERLSLFLVTPDKMCLK